MERFLSLLCICLLTSVSTPFPSAPTAALAAEPCPAGTALTIDPALAFAGDPGFTLTVKGKSFRPDSLVVWDGAAIPTTFRDTCTLRVSIADIQIATPGRISITVEDSLLRGATLEVLPLVARIYVPLVTRSSVAQLDRAENER